MLELSLAIIAGAALILGRDALSSRRTIWRHVRRVRRMESSHE